MSYPAELRSNRFTFKDETFIAELSDLPELAASDNTKEFIIESSKTGITVLFRFETKDTEDGSIMGWRFKAAKLVSPEGRFCDLPARFQGLKALIIND